MEFVGYSWFNDDQFVATKDLPFFDAMVTRPPEVTFTGQRPSMVVSPEKRPATPPPTIWLPYWSRYAKRRLGGPSTPQLPLVEPSRGGVDPAVTSVKGGEDPTENQNENKQFYPRSC